MHEPPLHTQDRVHLLAVHPHAVLGAQHYPQKLVAVGRVPVDQQLDELGDSSTEADMGSSDRFIMRGGGVQKPVVDYMGQKVPDRDTVAADEQDPPG